MENLPCIFRKLLLLPLCESLQSNNYIKKVESKVDDFNEMPFTKTHALHHDDIPPGSLMISASDKMGISITVHHTKI